MNATPQHLIDMEQGSEQISHAPQCTNTTNNPNQRLEVVLGSTGTTRSVGQDPSVGITKKSSDALATTLSSCQVPGGTGLLVASVVGKNLMNTINTRNTKISQASLSLATERRKEPNDNEPNGNGRAGFLALPPRSMSIHGLHISMNSPFVGASMTYLFDKVLSVSDCERTGHFVIPKRKVEEYFPPINEPGGIWMKLLDDKGEEWSFKLSFWLSKGSRVYYFKKFYPFVQSQNLVAGDTVVFSRLEPEGTLYMSAKDRVQKSPQQKETEQTEALTEGHASEDRFRERECTNEGAKHLANYWSMSIDDEVLPRQEKPTTIAVNEVRPFRKRKRTNFFPRISLNTNRSNLIDHLGVSEVPLAPKWKDIQDLLQPAPGVVPTIVTIDCNDIEEYEEPPVLAMRPC